MGGICASVLFLGQAWQTRKRYRNNAQNWFNLSDEGIEDAVYDSYAFRKFMKIDFVNEQVPDETTLLKFRHMIEKNHIGEVFFNS